MKSDDRDQPICPVEMYDRDGKPVGPCAEPCYDAAIRADQPPVPPGRVRCRRGHTLTRSLLLEGDAS